MSDNLKICPFCGGNAYYHEEEQVNCDGDGLQFFELISCEDCAANVSSRQHDDIHQAWNSRDT